MTISSQTIRNEYTGNGSQTVFPYTFKIFDDDDVAVYVEGVLRTKTTHYTVSGVGEESGGNVTMLEAPDSGDSVVLILDVDLLQTTDYVPGDDFAPETHERALDKLTQICLMLNERIRRAAVLDIHSTYEDLSLPDPEAGKFLAWNSGLTGLQNSAQVTGATVSSFMETLIDDADIDTALQTLCIHQTEIEITDATAATEIAVEGSSSYGYNGDSWSKVDNIGKGETVGGISMAANGSYIQIDSATLLTGNVIVVLAAVVNKNSTTTDVVVNGFVNQNDIQLTFLQDGNPGTVVDLSSLVDTGNGEITIRLTYITAS